MSLNELLTTSNFDFLNYYKNVSYYSLINDDSLLSILSDLINKKIRPFNDVQLLFNTTEVCLAILESQLDSLFFDALPDLKNYQDALKKEISTFQRNNLTNISYQGYDASNQEGDFQNNKVTENTTDLATIQRLRQELYNHLNKVLNNFIDGLIQNLFIEYNWLIGD